MNELVPTIGKIAIYRLSGEDAKAINRRRSDAQNYIGFHRHNANGVQIHVGNEVREGDEFPMMITQVWGDSPNSCVNGQLMLDGNDLFWLTSVSQDLYGDGRPRSFTFPRTEQIVEEIVNQVKAIIDNER